ncbi:hypothetical protein B0H14DRAFT_2741437 [Mycena olivaceomarginata]|nr:hypothetical protein B0H14DRAFT_2741437 [Mycena olivaceomarginata]
MYSSAPLRSVCLLTLLTRYFPSVLTQYVGPILEKRDAFSSSGLASASWIWFPEPDILTTAPAGSVAFTKTVVTPSGKTAASASISIAVDNNFTLWCNAQPIGASDGIVADGWQSAQILSAALNATSNVFSVLGTNSNPGTPGAANPAGLLAAIRIFYTDGSNDTILSDSTWLASGMIPADFPLPHDLSSFVHVQVATKYGSGPWGTSVTVPTPSPNPLNLTGSSWIWSTSNAAADAPVGTVGFRKTVVSPSGKSATSATVLLSADNTFQLLINGQYVGAPPFDNNAVGSFESWEYAQRFAVTLTPLTNVFTVLATNFPGRLGGTSSAGVIAALQIGYSDGSTTIIRTDASWLAGPFTSASLFLAAADSTLGPAISQGLFGMSPWGQLRGVADALNALKLPANNAAVVPTTTGSSTTRTISNPLPAPTSTFGVSPTFSDPSSTTSPTPNPDAGGARALPMNGCIPLTLVFSLAVIISSML